MEEYAVIRLWGYAEDMKNLTIYQDDYNDCTVISNRFIDEYMIEANDAQIKIYLYLLRIMGSHLATSISVMADTFNHTEKDVLRALKYWEKKRLLTLDYDETKNIVGIHLQEPCKSAGQGEAKPEKSAAQSSSYARAPEGFEAREKPSYSLDQVKAFRQKEDTEQLLFIIEAYIGRPLSSNDIKTILFICDQLNFSADLVDYLVQYCVGRGKRDFRYIEKVAVSWAEENITTPAQAASVIKKYDKNVYGIMNALGKSGIPTDREMEYINRWCRQYLLPPDVIREACGRTVLATDKHRFEYADSILTSWHKANVRQLSDIKNADAAYQRSKTVLQPSRTAANKFNQFQQNSYDFSELEKEILSN